MLACCETLLSFAPSARHYCCHCLLWQATATVVMVMEATATVGTDMAVTGMPTKAGMVTVTATTVMTTMDTDTLLITITTGITITGMAMAMAIGGTVTGGLMA